MTSPADPPPQAATLGATMRRHTAAFGVSQRSWRRAFTGGGSFYAFGCWPLVAVILLALALKWGVYLAGVALLLAGWVLTMAVDVAWTPFRLLGNRG